MNLVAVLNGILKIDRLMQLRLPYMQLKQTDGVFRLYVKPSEDKTFYLIEESLSPILLPQVLDSIRNPLQPN
jgi:hypothetical protein